ncbi:hypothetical protein Taro_051062 [Colocasia esculenta]|uniref:Uncharacterized protein n=1 Tax=Colocasia esculenta TaxID=4460 RepID=A0A843XFH7_COLES|nr:hypothetical protein [Colocasia esculenta]
MKASAKLRREDPAAPALLRAKIPVAVLSLPFIAAASAGGRRDLSFQLRTAFSAGPSLHLSYHPFRQGHPFSLSLRSGFGLWGSPRRSPLLLSAHLSSGAAGAALSFSIRVSYSLGDFSFKPIAVSGRPDPNPAASKENGGGVDGPLQWSGEAAARGEAAEERTHGTAVTVRTTLPVVRRAAVRLRWAVRLPRAAEGGGGGGGSGAAVGTGMPFLAVDKISIVSLEEEGGHGGAEEKAAVTTAVWEGDKDEEALKGMLFWMSREAEEMKREQGVIKESLEELRRASPASARRGGAAAPGSRRQPHKGV